MSKDDVEIARDVIAGYEPWKIAQGVRAQDVSVSAYLDRLAEARQLDVYQQIHEFAADDQNYDDELGKEVRRILGLA